MSISIIIYIYIYIYIIYITHVLYSTYFLGNDTFAEECANGYLFGMILNKHGLQVCVCVCLCVCVCVCTLVGRSVWFTCVIVKLVVKTPKHQEPELLIVCSEDCQQR